MSKKPEEIDVYYIPANFIETGTVFGGMLKLRNVIEAGIILAITGFPVFNLAISLRAKIITACLTVLPLCLLALIGVSGESLSSFIISFFRFVKNRRIIGSRAKQKKYTLIKKSAHRIVRKPMKKRERHDFDSEVPPEHSNDYIPIQKIENGIIYTKDKRYIKIIEIEPINFLLRSAREQKNIIYSFISYLKISPVKLQFKVISKRADINRHLNYIRQDIARETDEKCIEMQKDYANLIRQIGSREAVTRRFFVIFEYESNFGNKRFSSESQAIAELNTAVHTARNYLLHCGNEVIKHDNEDEFLTDALYSILNRRTSTVKSLQERQREIAEKYKNNIENIPAVEYISPDNIDFTHAK